MAENIVHLPRPVSLRPEPHSLGFYVRVGHNDHREVLDLIATGERGIFGFVIDARNVERQAELLHEAKRHNFDLILDPKTQPMGLPGGHSKSLAELPWGAERHHHLTDFDGDAGRAKVERIVEMAVENGFTQILGPSHLISGPNDPWLRRDVRAMGWMADSVARHGGGLAVVYSLALPMEVLRKKAERQAVVAALADAPHESLWLKVENFGDTATGEKTAAYIEACRDFHQQGVPVIGDYVGGLPALGALAFGSVGGIAHGVTVNQNFSASSWRRPPTGRGGGGGWRVYVPQLDMLMKPAVAEVLLSAPRIRARCGCRDTHCCPHGPRDMIARPVRHALYQRAREIEMISETPSGIRVERYLDEKVRRVSDDVAAIAGAAGLSPALKKTLEKKQDAMSRFRQVMVHTASEVDAAPSAAIPKRHVRRDSENK